MKQTAALLDIGTARVFFDGIFSQPRLAHPEGLAVHPDGSIWCGTETGHLLRISADGATMQCMASTGGFLLGLAIDRQGNCYACDLMHRAIFRYDAKSGAMDKFASSGIAVPNYPVLDEARQVMYVSDSRGNANPGPGVFRFDLQTGAGGVWCNESLAFANGLALTADGQGLYVVQSDAACVSLLPVQADGSAGPSSLVADMAGTVPDGLALADDGTLYIACYEPSQIWRLSPAGEMALLIEDRKATTLAHPTNIALTGGKMYSANLGRWHISEIDLAANKAERA